MEPRPCAHDDLMVDESLTEIICRVCGAACSVRERNEYEEWLENERKKQENKNQTA